MRTETVDLFGIPIANIDFAGLCRCLDAQIARGEPGYVVTPNVNHVCTRARVPAFARAYEDAFLYLCDGVPLVWCALLFGKRLRQKLSGSDMVPQISAWCAGRGYRVYLLGGRGGAAEESARRLQAANPGLEIAGTDCPPYGFHEDPEVNESVIARVREARPDVCFVALGSPKQEIWMHQHYQAMGVPVLMGVGAALDFVSGQIIRAPRWAQRMGWEWLWRLCQEPRRLWRRYLLEDQYFFVLLAGEIARQWRGEANHGTGAPDKHVADGGDGS